MLWKDRQTVTIQFPASKDLEGLGTNDIETDWDLEVRTRHTYGHYLEIVQNLLPSIEFGATNWGYLLPDKTGGFRIVQRQKIFKKISCPLWAPLIRETEIEYTVWGMGFERRGLWRGMEVDVFYAWNDMEFWRLNRGMYGYRAVQDLDVTFEVLGHLISEDGTVIGLVSEAAWGRMIKPSDATLIYKTIGELQHRGVIYRGCLTNRFMIADGKVRLVELNCITPYEDRQKLLEDAEVWHWKELGQLFGELRTHGPYGCLRLPSLAFYSTYKDLQFLPPPPRPDLPFGGMLLYPTFFAMCDIEAWPDFEAAEREPDDCPTKEPSRRRRPLRPTLGLLAGPEVAGTPRRTRAQDEVGPLRAISALSQRARGHSNSSLFHPYRHARMHVKPTVLSTSEDTASTGSVSS